MSTAYMEFAVKMTCENCVNSVKSVLNAADGIETVKIDLQEQQVIVKSLLPSNDVLNLIESSGCNAILKGFEAKFGDNSSAVAEFNSEIFGVVRFIQLDTSTCLFDASFSGLSPSKSYTFNVHEYGDISDGYSKVGDVYSTEDENGIGYATKEIANNLGNCSFRIEKKNIKIYNIIGRSFVVTDAKNLRISGAVIARSAGLFQNPKKICQCDGVTLWEERDKRK